MSLNWQDGLEDKENTRYPTVRTKFGLPNICGIAGGLMVDCHPRAPGVEAENSPTHKFHIQGEALPRDPKASKIKKINNINLWTPHSCTHLCTCTCTHRYPTSITQHKHVKRKESFLNIKENKKAKKDIAGWLALL